uniref:Peroxidase n=1 Tax=Ananas comosus var. bracteatus TaxID=296719 RepID=A0A6V7QDQ5_ANACO|nr:unnamed protein product [Ananas comosus var. bracteatus]
MAKIGVVVLLLFLSLYVFPQLGSAQLQQNYYANICPNVETIVRNAVTKKIQETFVTVGATIRLFFHDCFVQGCDASVIIVSTGNNTAEKDNPINLSLAGDGFDTVIRAKAAVDAVPQCTNKVSCADILAMATRDVIALAGGPSYAVELGRLDGLSSTASSVNGMLPPPSFNLDQLTSIFAANGLSQSDMIALSAAHTVGFAHCSTFANRLYNFSPGSPVDPSFNQDYAAQLQAACPPNADPNLAVANDPVTPGSSTTSTTRTYNKEWASSPQTKSSSRTRDRRPSSTHGPEPAGISAGLCYRDHEDGAGRSQNRVSGKHSPQLRLLQLIERKKNKTKQGCFTLFKLQNCIHS